MLIGNNKYALMFDVITSPALLHTIFLARTLLSFSFTQMLSCQKRTSFHTAVVAISMKAGQLFIMSS